jgi:hypothetical protein
VTRGNAAGDPTAFDVVVRWLNWEAGRRAREKQRATPERVTAAVVEKRYLKGKLILEELMRDEASPELGP